MGTEVSGLQVSVVFSPAPRQWLEVLVQLAEPCPVAEVLRQSGLLAQLPEGLEPAAHVGIWGRKVALSHVVRDQDRVEIYRDLRVDPKVARRERFVKQGARATGLFSRRRAQAKAGY
jgi:putative ubiquitin-RnfH superfamily antitoxin RatB of RatAB toxin-antitoxin module